MLGFKVDDMTTQSSLSWEGSPGQGNSKRRSLVRLGFHIDLPFMLLNDPVDDG
jgi:hypothetical protein